MKLTTLLFGLLLAVGWTSNVFAQSATYKAEDIKDWTYTWEDAGGTTQTSKYIDEVTDPYQMYGLLRWIYMDKRFPGPTYSAYKADGTTRERKVYYGGMDGGWEIPGTPISGSATVNPVGTITIEFGGTSTSGGNTGGNFSFTSIQVKSGSTVLTSWDYATWGTSVPTGWGFSSNASNTAFNDDGNNSSCYISKGGTLTIPSSLLQGSTSVQVIVRGFCDSGHTNNPATITVNNEPQGPITSTTETNYTWNVQGTTTGGDTGVPAIIISGTNNNARIYSITVTSGGTTIFTWNKSTDGTAGSTSTGHWPVGMQLSAWKASSSNPYIIFSDNLDPITLYGWMFDGYNSVTVTISAAAASGNTGSLIVNGDSKSVTGTTATNYTWTVYSRDLNAPVKYVDNTYTPNEEGYTALVVKLKNKIVKDSINNTYNTKEEIINYLRTNVKSIQLLTDGLRIGEGEDVGTVFNCPSTDVYNRFFFLGKGQARQKSDMVILEQTYEEKLIGEDVPFRQMFEQFSPTGGKDGDDIKDFYSKMMKGEIFPVVHDCLSVIQNQHEFSMSGHTGETSYDMPGMNFFIPDYRLKYWELQDSILDNGSYVYYTVDGRDMNPYQPASANKSNNKSTFYDSPSKLAVWYAQYDTAHHAPVTGIYLLTLQGEANKVSDYSEPDNRYYNVDLYWRSSLNEMAGSAVEQTYIIYQVVTDSVTGVRRRVAIDTVKNCTDFRPHLQLDTLYQQHAHSYTLTYIIEGSPVDSDHPGFVAWSNEVKLIIPGYDDFMILKLHHYESDFEIRRVGDVDYNAENGTYDEKNYYRNYLQPENDFVNGISKESILSGYDSFMLYRSYTVDGIQVKEAVAKLKFAVDQQGKVRYKITYIDEHENYNSPNFPNGAQLDNIINSLINN